ncbi:hypothetical protein ABZ570_12385 [Micromonospora sp. NPDC007271]|uniref:hypothetical protein n=1 Tax=Micromonospora sp. NPDC007271 TaxID=3154587 RepID=UPI0033D035CF
MTPPGAAPARPTRPVVVTVAFWLQIATVAVLLALVGLVVAAALDYNGQIDEALRQVPDADPMEVSDERSGNLVMTLTLGVPALLLAAWLAATALPLSKGSNAARILVFVAAGAQLLVCLGQGCGGVLVIPLMLAAGDPEFDPALDSGVDGADWEQSKFLDTLYSQGDPGAILAFGGIGVMLVLALTAAVVVLLLLPDSRRWFRPASAAWPPPAPYGYWPGHPAAAYPGGYPAVPYPGGHAAAYPPAVGPLPPGYLLCPDPALHLAHPPAGPSAPGQGTSPWAPAPEAGPWGPAPEAGPSAPAPEVGPSAPAPEAGPFREPGRDDAAPGATGQPDEPGAGTSGS